MHLNTNWFLKEPGLKYGIEGHWFPGHHDVWYIGSKIVIEDPYIYGHNLLVIFKILLQILHWMQWHAPAI